MNLNFIPNIGDDSKKIRVLVLIFIVPVITFIKNGILM